MDYYVLKAKNLGSFTKSIMFWTLIAGVTGIICGGIGALFHQAVLEADRLFAGHPRIVWLLPLLGAAVVLSYRAMKVTGFSTDSIIDAADRGIAVKAAVIPAIFLGTVLSHLGGASVGREGAAFQMGGTVGGQVSRLFRLTDDREIGVAVKAGMSAFFAGIFGLPVTAAVFVNMVINVGKSWSGALYPELLASLIASGIARRFGVAPLRAVIFTPDNSGIADYIKVAMLAALCALVSTLFCDVLHETEKIMEKLIGNPYVRICAGGLLIAAVTSLLHSTVYTGAGMNMIEAAVTEGAAKPWDFLMKILLTAIAAGAGFKGGEVVPSLAVGASFGCIMGGILGIPAGFAAAIGMVSVFGGCSNSLIAPIFLAIEMFGSKGIEFYALACIVSYMMSGYSGFYYNQRIVYSKAYPERIDLPANGSIREVKEDIHERAMETGRRRARRVERIITGDEEDNRR